MDAWHQWGGDLVAGPNGDLLPVDAGDETLQRILRRLMTAQPDYYWHMDYGAGLPAKVGEPGDPAAIRALILSQMLLEQGVSPAPAPDVLVTPFPNGLSVEVRYVDAATGATKAAAFDITR
jgi:hypothetical protein